MWEPPPHSFQVNTTGRGVVAQNWRPSATKVRAVEYAVPKMPVHGGGSPGPESGAVTLHAGLGALQHVLTFNRVFASWHWRSGVPRTARTTICPLAAQHQLVAS